MRLVARTLFALVFAACSAPPQPLSFEGRVEGELRFSSALRGDAYVALLEGTAPGAPGLFEPFLLTAVSDTAIARGERRYRFPVVPPNPYGVWGFLDVNRNVRPEVDVLSQPGAGDRRAPGVLAFNLQPGETLSLDLALSEHVGLEPPAFQVEGVGEVKELPEGPSLEPLRLSAASLGLLDPQRLGFSVRVVDADGDGRADDANGDGLPDLEPQLALRFVPRPGQTVPTSSEGAPALVVLPLVFDPAPFLALLGGQPGREVRVEALQAFFPGQAVAISEEPGRGAVQTTLAAVPVGDYELWVLQRGQFWKVPNGLAEDAALAEDVRRAQGTRFRVLRGAVGDR